jgi:hypothetical protein
MLDPISGLLKSFFCANFYLLKERWLSGRKQHTANVLTPQGVPGFESLPLRIQFCLPVNRWRGARAAEWTGLENRSTRNGTGGSNPSLSANNL